MKLKRRMPIGAEVVDGGVHFRVWAPDCQTVDVALEKDKFIPLEKESDGYFSGFISDVHSGMLYQFRLNHGAQLYPDPASRYQPSGPHGPSVIIDSASFRWSDENWKGIATTKGQVLYEMHIGTFTKVGTWRSAMEKLEYLKELGVTIIEMMPIADFTGNWGWGYDGVNLFAPTRLYGTPDDLRQFVNRAHLLGIGVMLDVVYNHFGPDGNYIQLYAENYHTENYKTDWGKAINFEGDSARGVREFFISNAGYWIEEYHFDGLRLDATQNIYDASTPHILTEIVQVAKEKSGHRKIIFIAENEPQEIHLIKSVEEGGYNIDGLWNDDFHHTATVRLTGRSEAYYFDYMGSVQEFISAIKYGYLYQGQYYRWQKKNRGTSSLNIEPHKFVHYLQNHDQIANSHRGLRLNLISDFAILRMMTLLLILSPSMPLLFQGQEFASTSPFHYFADHNPHLARAVWEGRKNFLTQFPSFDNFDMQKYYPDPGDPQTFECCKLKWEETEKSFHKEILKLHKDLIALRQGDSTILSPKKIDGSVLGNEIFLIRYFSDKDDDRLLLFNFGIDSLLSPIPEPLFAPPQGKKWKRIFSTQNPIYGGIGLPDMTEEGSWTLPGHTALVFKPIKPSGLK